LNSSTLVPEKQNTKVTKENKNKNKTKTKQNKQTNKQRNKKDMLWGASHER
jgi:hypothetical protein